MEKKKKEKKEEIDVIEISGMKFEFTRRSKILILTFGIAIVLAVLGVLSGNRVVMANFIVLSSFIVIVPQFFFMYEKYRDIKEMEEKFPVFLRDVIESLSAGMPLHHAIVNSSKFDYGKLSPEVKKIANQISWGRPLNKVLRQFAHRVRRSKRMFTSINIINESYQSGGDVVSILNTVTDHSILLEEAEKERQSLLNQYVILMYAISIIFIVIIVAINKLMIPIFQETAAGADVSEALGMVNPCKDTYGFEGAICGFYKATAEYVFSIDPTTISAYYVSMFFFMSIIQAAFSGLVAGQIGENSMTAGIKHSLILVAITFGTFLFLIHFGILTS
jgi:flagellar protein FlaJ